ncbi:hypothetical protein [Pseudoalteromonas sp. BSi20495]|uniref:hypothetical protein n=1 Tax=Pseudoalteromonas sp. BSi20495 TaxID=386429 RepID=UPI00023159C9|nr:hypothetical protein [Pseudoalteromonas sp. BSi20495]GAA78200.1 hypothetical protein P20495_0691 [Pseudoalteromonas sp. BSi20495]
MTIFTENGELSEDVKCKLQGLFNKLCEETIPPAINEDIQSIKQVFINEDIESRKEKIKKLKKILDDKIKARRVLKTKNKAGGIPHDHEKTILPESVDSVKKAPWFKL